MLEFTDPSYRPYFRTPTRTARRGVYVHTFSQVDAQVTRARYSRNPASRGG
jgi:hypothetical protein